MRHGARILASKWREGVTPNGCRPFLRKRRGCSTAADLPRRPWCFAARTGFLFPGFLLMCRSTQRATDKPKRNELRSSHLDWRLSGQDAIQSCAANAVSHPLLKAEHVEELRLDSCCRPLPRCLAKIDPGLPAITRVFDGIDPKRTIASPNWLRVLRLATPTRVVERDPVES